MNGFVIILHPNGRRALRCMKCGLTTWHPYDVRYRYCGYCHTWHEAWP